jgi:HPt (histidine-containing phosphotransfer) domain-containing protein
MRSGRDRRVLQSRRSGKDRRRASDSDLASSSKIAAWQIKGLKLADALNKFGDEGIVLHVLQVFATDTPALVEKIRQVKRENLKEYMITVHGIKGSCRGIFAESLAAQAEKLEQAAREDRFTYVESHNEAFILKLEELLTSLQETLKAEINKPLAEAPDRQVLADLWEASKSFDIDGIDRAMAELEKYEYEKEQDLMQWLRETIKVMGFKEIAERLARILAPQPIKGDDLT